MKEVALAIQQPWKQAWWRASEGNIWVLFYIIAIHLVALVGLVLFPLPGWRVFGMALAAASLGGIGTSVAYHRALAHRSVKLNVIVEQTFIFFRNLQWVGFTGHMGTQAPATSRQSRHARGCVQSTSWGLLVGSSALALPVARI